MLDDEEIAWLDAYHARVRDTLTPLVDPDTAHGSPRPPSRSDACLEAAIGPTFRGRKGWSARFRQIPCIDVSTGTRPKRLLQPLLVTPAKAGAHG